jgi:hypothetical protein
VSESIGKLHQNKKSLKIGFEKDDSMTAIRKILFLHFIAECYQSSLKDIIIVVCRRNVQLFSMATSQRIIREKKQS